jgi:pimeloyl-ACP methyl ester carboxylesterase
VMANFVLIHGASSDSWYWHLVAAELRAKGHDVMTPDLPCDDDSAGLSEYANVVVDAIGKRTNLIVVAQSMGGFIAPLVCDRVRCNLLILIAGMVPLPGERLGDWWTNTGWERARRDQAEREGRPVDADFDPMFDFFHDVPDRVVAEAFARGERRQSGTPFQEQWPLTAWPDVPTRFVLCRDDRFFPADLMRGVVHQRLGIAPDEMDGGHLPALARPSEVAERLETYRIEIEP